MYGIEDFNLEDFNLISIMEIVDENKYVQTMDIEVADKHHSLYEILNTRMNVLYHTIQPKLYLVILRIRNIWT